MSTPSATVPLSLHAGPGAGFDEPFEMLAACHQRVARMLRLLERLGQHLKEHGSDTMAADAARDVMRYFDQAAPRHHEDEERHVLPRLRSSAQAAHRALAARLAAEHLEMAASWAALRPDLVAVAERRWTADEGAPAAFARWKRFAELYAGHAAAEEHEAFPFAASLVVGDERAAMGREMAARRGAT
jgi:hemerythrin-like domain-containing protein